MAQEKLPSAVEVAAYLLKLAATDPDYPQKRLTHKQLQKLLYYVQGWSFGRRDKPIYKESLHAWREGPVVESVYEKYSKLGNKAIPDRGDDAGLPRLVRAFIASVWDDYKGFTERELIEKSHKDRPWRAAREGYSPHEPSDVPMKDSDLREFFSQPSTSALTSRELKLLAAQADSVPSPTWYSERSPCDPPTER